jgi:hypothetical protein
MGVLLPNEDCIRNHRRVRCRINWWYFFPRIYESNGYEALYQREQKGHHDSF